MEKILMITHQLATEKDFREIYEMYMDKSSNKFLTYDTMSSENFKSIYNELIRTNTLYIVKDGDETIATYRLIPKTDRQSHICYLGGFTIKPNMQGKGFGKQILSDIKKNAQAAGKIRIELTVSLDNMAAIALYEKTGFLVEGVVKKNYKLGSTGHYYDEYLMALVMD